MMNFLAVTPALRTARLVASLFLLVASLPAWPQSHQETFGNYIVRSSVTGSEAIPDESARLHGITRAPDVAIVNVTVLRKGSQLTETLPARVQVEVANLTGVRRPIAMRETATDNGWVSYTGTFKFAPREVIDFTIRAQPVESDQPIEMTYREHLPVRSGGK